MYKIPGGKQKEVDPPAHDSPAIVRTQSFRILMHTVALSGYYRDGYSLPRNNQRHECKPTCVFCRWMNLSREWPSADLTLAAPLCLFSVGEGVKKLGRRDKRYELLSLSCLQGQHPLSSTQWLGPSVVWALTPIVWTKSEAWDMSLKRLLFKVRVFNLCSRARLSIDH